jgi:hypothetical protein
LTKDLILLWAGVEQVFRKYIFPYVSNIKNISYILYIMNDTQKLENMRIKSLARQKKYYNANKAKILEKKKTDRDLVKIINTPIPEVIIPTEFTLEMCIEVLSTIETENTRKKYTTDIKRVFNLAKLDKFVGSIDEHNSIKKSVCESKYSLSTQRGSIQALLVFIEKSGMAIDKKVLSRYALLLDVAKVKTDDENEQRQADTANSVIPYDEYLLLIHDKFEETSKERLIASLYNEIPMRDNFGSLRLIESFEEDDGVGNFLLRNCEHIILNNYKTKNVYNKVVYDLTAKLGVLLTRYIDACEIKDFLFPEHIKKGLSKFVIDMNNKIGLKISINTLRKMKVTDFLLRADINAEDRFLQSRKMGHSVKTQKTYKRQIKEYVVEPKLLEALKN